MSRIKERIKISVKLKNERIEKVVNVEHEGIKKFKDWPQDSKQALKEWVQNTINKGEREAWLPFANFEASVQFNLNTRREQNIEYLCNDFIINEAWDETEFKNIPNLTDDQLNQLVKERKDYNNEQ